MGDANLQDSMVADGLTDAFHGYHMGITGRRVIFFSFFLFDKSQANIKTWDLIFTFVYAYQLRM